jgi:hypothetical protein
MYFGKILCSKLHQMMVGVVVVLAGLVATEFHLH